MGHGIEIEIEIGGRAVGAAHTPYVIAEISANHHGRYDTAVALVHAAKEAGADAVKLQTYTPDSMTLPLDTGPFRVGHGTLWEGRTLHDLYAEAQTPWEWHEGLAAEARDVGIALFSTPFDARAVELLDEMDVPALKIASFEVIDLDLIAKAASTGRPLIVSTGMATIDEIGAAVRTAREGGASGVALLRCNSSYPAPPTEMDLRTIPNMAEAWQLPVGLSDHTLGIAAAVAATALGSSLLEKHITLSRDEPGPDSAFSLEPHEFASMVSAVREAHLALGMVRYGPSPSEQPSLAFRRSLYVAADVKKGDVLTERVVRAIRPGGGLPPSALRKVLGRRAAADAAAGTPLSWDLVGGPPDD